MDDALCTFSFVMESSPTEFEASSSDDKPEVGCDFNAEEASDTKARKYKIVIKRKALYSEVASEKMVVSECKRQRASSPAKPDGLNMEVSLECPEARFVTDTLQQNARVPASYRACTRLGNGPQAKPETTMMGLNSAVVRDSLNAFGRSGNAIGLRGCADPGVDKLSAVLVPEQAVSFLNSSCLPQLSVCAMRDSMQVAARFSPTRRCSLTSEETMSKVDLDGAVLDFEQAGTTILKSKEEDFSLFPVSITPKAKRTPLAIPSVPEAGGGLPESQTAVPSTVLPAKRSPLPLPSVCTVITCGRPALGTSL